MNLRIEWVDPQDQASVHAWHAAYFAADIHGREWATPYHLEELRADLQASEKGRWVAAYSGVLDGDVVVAGAVETPLLDNLSFAWIQVHVRPEVRGRGHGSAMLTHLEGIALDRGRTLFNVETAWPLLAPADGAGVPVVAWLTTRGYALGLVDVQRNLRLPVADGLLELIAAETVPHHPAYRLHSWVGPVPDEFVESYAVLVASLAVEAPVGDLHLEPESADIEGLRDREATMLRQGRTKYNTVALNERGEVVAYTDVVTSVHEGDRAFQWGTLVRGADRGRRLGLGVKAANLALLQRERPDIVRVTTYNAEVNTQMIGVNERLGYRPVERLGEFQKRVVPRSG
jgi:GNAT superfamily N-acetyltransferase